MSHIGPFVQVWAVWQMKGYIRVKDDLEGVALKEFINQKRQRKRVFQRLSSGMYFRRDKEIRFLTLTSSPRSGDMRSDWKKFVKRLNRTCPIDFIEHLSGDNLMSYKNMLEPIRFVYMAVFTNEGHGVVHCVYSGDYLPVRWVQEIWNECHNAYGVNIKKVRSVYNAGGLAGYILAQYVKGQNAIRHYQMAKGWLPAGHISRWKEIKYNHRSEGMDSIVMRWHAFLDEHRTIQETLKY